MFSHSLIFSLLSALVLSVRAEEGVAYTTRQVLDNATLSHTFVSCNFTGITSSENGGALYYSTDNISYSSLSMTECLFTNCSCTGTANGGAIYMCGYSLKLINCEFIGCTSSVNGGALCLVLTQFTTIACRFTNCTGVYGGAVWADAINSDIQATLFYNCICSGNETAGGGMYATTTAGFYILDEKRTLEMSGCTFVGCGAIAQNNAYGGGFMYATDEDELLTAAITFTTFYYCHANSNEGIALGGGLCFGFNSEETVALSQIQVVGCIASTNGQDGLGGGIAWGLVSSSPQFNQTTWITNATFSSNAAYSHGADLAILSDHTLLTTSIFDSTSTTSTSQSDRVSYVHLTTDESSTTSPDSYTNCDDWLTQVSSSSDEDSDSSSSSSTTTIVVVVVVIVVVLAVAAACAFYFLYWRPRHRVSQATHDDVTK